VNVTTEISGTLPTLKSDDLLKLTDDMGAFVLDEVRLNFGQGGRPKVWPALKSGMPSFLFKTGSLLQSIQRQPAQLTLFGSEVTVGTTGGIPYRWVHQEGYAKRNIPQREYMVLVPDSIKHLVEMAGSRIVTILNAKGENIAA
jgi:phage gpG-like protein